MNGIKLKLRRLKYKLRHDFFSVENVVLVLAIFLCLLWTYQSVAAMSRNWELTERLAAEKKELELLNVEVETAALQNEYYRSDEYQELLARKYLDKKTKDEKMVVMPENSEGARNKRQTITKEVTEKDYSNFEKWMMYLFPDY
ncbi:hypothetical protein IKF28_02450 [Candidatus Saccharibacteria bacterium]|nr:hypothetical protein [Candidatus Saccharibacteria bacterium]MBR3122283.1 hypothetical protein [Candidatus Saccharibacteria bacterium]